MSNFDKLIAIVEKLRGPNGCPWDKAQTHESLTPFAIEEAHELEEAIQNNDIENMKEELGDLLFQSVLHSEVAKQNGYFDIDDVIEVLNEKMIRRHPHVFGQNVVADNPEQVVQNWEDIKKTEKQSELFDIPKAFPALLRSHKIGKRSARIDFDWQNHDQVLTQVENELTELKDALSSEDKAHIEEELGDVLFSLAQLGRHLKIDAEKALRRSNQKFIKRVEKMMEIEPDFEKTSRPQKEQLWQQAKRELKK